MLDLERGPVSPEPTNDSRCRFCRGHRLRICWRPRKVTPSRSNTPSIVKRFTIAQLRDHGIRPVVSVNHGPTISLYYLDPEEKGVEFLIDRFKTSEEATAFMTGPIFKRNPVGIDIEPEAMLARMRAGARDEELTSYDADKTVNVAETMARHGLAMHVD